MTDAHTMMQLAELHHWCFWILIEISKSEFYALKNTSTVSFIK